MMQSASRDVSVASDKVGGPKPLSVEDAVGNAFLQLLAEGDGRGQDQHDFSPHNEVVLAFAQDVRRRKDEPLEAYDGFVDLAASAAVNVLVHGPDRPEGIRKDPAPLTMYRRMLSLVKHALSGVSPNSDSQRQSRVEDPPRLKSQREAEAAKRPKLQDETYDAGYSAGLEAGAKAEAAKRQSTAADAEEAYSRGFAAGQRRLMNSEITFAFARGQKAEQERIRACLEEGGHQASQVRKVLEGILRTTNEPSEPVRQTRPSSTSILNPSAQPSRQYSRRGSEYRQASPPARSPGIPAASEAMAPSLEDPLRTVPQPQSPVPAPERVTVPRRRVGRQRLLPSEGDGRHALATCVFCGIQVSQNSILRHKRRHHPAELAAVGIPLQSCPCWWPGCGQLRDNLVHNQLTTHLQRKHNYTPPGDPNALTENIKYIRRMPIDLQVSIIAEAAQQLNAVKLRIQDLEARLRRQKPSYASRHGLPDPRQLHESRLSVLSALLRNRARLPFIVQELRQLTRARGARSQVRGDEGTWWEVADDLEAGLDPSGKLAQAVAALPPPASGPTIPLNPSIFSDPPNIYDPAWKPQYALPLQTGWEISGPDDNPVWRPVRSTGAAQAGGPGAGEPAVKAEPEEEEEEDGRYQELISEITRRVVDGKEQSDWDESSSDEDRGDGSADAEDHAPDRSSKRHESRRRKRSATSGSSPKETKFQRAG